MKIEGIERLVTEFDLQYQKEYHALLGKVGGYPVVISGLNTRATCVIHVAAMIDLEEEKIRELQKVSSSISKIQNQEGSFEVILKRKCTNDDKESTIIQVLQYVCLYLQEHPVDSCCPHCGNKHEVRSYGVYNRIIWMCDSCYERLRQQIEESDDAKTNPHGKIGNGILGAIIGATIGVASWCLIYQIGFFAPIAGFVLAFGAWKGYTLFGGKTSKLAIAIVVLIIVSMVLLSQVLCLALSIYDLLKADYTFTFSKALQSVAQYLQIDNIRNSFIRDLSIGYLVTAFASYTLLFLHQKYHKQERIQVDCLEHAECNPNNDK